MAAERFDGVALVTGGSRGIGLAIAQRLAADGARVCITARRADALAEALATLPAGRAIAVAGRAEDKAHRLEVLDRVADAFGRVDALVNVVGMNPVFGPVVDVDVEVARKIFEVNVITPLAWVQDVLADERLGFASHGGSVVNLSSVTGRTPSPGIGLYGISKAAVAHLTKTLAVELAPEIRVNAVSPAVVRTVFSRALYDGKEQEVESAYPLGRLGEPEDVAGAVAFLVSRDAAWITGEVLTVDGGLMAAGGVA
ncbi:SDR family oxidoreductase [Herbiconiux solani]|uniref:SDR family oxidoreductase n=1 Tax=Herbiconiux solani TaxID=661329 RepID=UPI0008242104|nr:SDR family oxidoreductase [Herbiconiux solani]